MTDADSAPAAAAAAACLARAWLWLSAGLSDTDPSVRLSLSVSRLAHEGPVLPEAEALPFSQVTGLGWGTFFTNRGKGRGGQRWRGKLHHVGAGSHSEGGLRTVPHLPPVGGARPPGATPRGAGSGLERGQRDSLSVVPGRESHASPYTCPSPRLARGRFPRSPL